MDIVLLVDAFVLQKVGQIDTLIVAEQPDDVPCQNALEEPWRFPPDVE